MDILPCINDVWEVSFLEKNPKHFARTDINCTCNALSNSLMFLFYPGNCSAFDVKTEWVELIINTP